MDLSFTQANRGEFMGSKQRGAAQGSPHHVLFTPGRCRPQVSCDGIGSSRERGTELMPRFIPAAKALSSHQNKANTCSFSFPRRAEDLAGHTSQFSAAQGHLCLQELSLPTERFSISPFQQHQMIQLRFCSSWGGIWLEGKPQSLRISC